MSLLSVVVRACVAGTRPTVAKIDAKNVDVKALALRENRGRFAVFCGINTFQNYRLVFRFFLTKFEKRQR
jgi:hypothetical protein